jgi:uncharacterized protein
MPYIVLKVSSQCNLACEYCHAGKLPKNELFMSIRLFSRILSEFVSYFQHLKEKHVLKLIFHGGEPLLAGLAFYREVLELESHVDTTDLLISNGIQTNGTLISGDWIELFKQGEFQIGLSIDGPADLHDKYRKDKRGEPTFKRVAQGIEMLQENKLPFGLLSVITEESPSHYEDFFQLLKERDIRQINFLPYVGSNDQKYVYAYSNFMRGFFDLWLENDTPFQVTTFCDILKQLGGSEGKYCYFTEKCRNFIFIDTLGRIYPCDRFIDDERYQIGTISASSFELIHPPPVSLRKQIPLACTSCKVKNICSSGCPALVDPQTGRDTYCSARKALIQHISRKLHEYDLSPDDIYQKFESESLEWVNTFTL